MITDQWRVLDNGCWRRELPDGTALGVLRWNAAEPNGTYFVWAWRHFVPERGDNSRTVTNIAVQGGFATDWDAAAAADRYWDEIVNADGAR